MSLDEFMKIWAQWELGVRSMVYQRAKGPVPAGDLDRFRKLEERMDQAWLKVGPFDRVQFKGRLKHA